MFLLVGGLGAGKTCLTQGILWGLGGDEYARSPTFVLVSQYSERLTLYHVDLYRLEGMSEIADLGLEEWLYGEGVCVVEWAEKAERLFPEQSVLIRMDYLGETSRGLTLEAAGSRRERLVEALNGVSEWSCP